MSSLASGLPTEQEAALAKASSQQLSGYVQMQVDVQTLRIDGVEVPLPTAALRFLVFILDEMAQGNGVRITPVRAELTVPEAADLLNVSRSYFVRLLDEGKIPHRKVGTRRRVRFEDIVRYKQQQEAEQDRLLDELTAQAQALDMGY